MNKTKDLGKDKIIYLVLSLALPAMIAQLVNVLYSIVDRMFVGQIPEIGNLALAAVGVCGPIVTLLSSFGTLIGIGGSILMSISLGQNDKEKAEKILGNSFIALIIVSLMLTLLFLLLKKPLIMWFGGSVDIFNYADTYLTIYTLGTFFALMALGLNYFITCQGYAMIAMMTVITGALTNIVLDAVFIKVFSMGIAGAAIATVIAQICSSIFAFTFLISKYTNVKIKRVVFDTNIIKKIVKLGFSPFIIIASDSVIIIALNALLQKYGGPGYGDILISAATVAQSYFLLITGPLIGITSGTQTIISFNFGAKDRKRIIEALQKIVMMALIFCTIMFVISQLFAKNFALMFTNDIQTLPLAIKAIKIFTIGIIFMAVQYALVDGLTALSNVKIALMLSLTRKSIYLLATFSLPLIFNIEYIFAAQPIADILASLITSFVFYKTFNRYLELHGIYKY